MDKETNMNEINKIVDSKFDLMDNQGYELVVNKVMESLDMLLPDKIYNGDETNLIESTINSLCKHITYSVIATLQELEISKLKEQVKELTPKHQKSTDILKFTPKDS